MTVGDPWSHSDMVLSILCLGPLRVSDATGLT